MAFEGWTNGIPPREWARILSIDVGGASPWAFEWSARDPQGYVVVYDEIYMVTSDIDKLVGLALPRMKHPDGDYPTWLGKLIDYENKIAAEDLRRRGILVTNAIKHNKLASVHRLHGYLHPNTRRPFPGWHPRAGQPGSPLMFIMSRCKNLIHELPQQKWKEGTGDSMKDEMDRSVANHAVDTILYTVRILPHPSEIKIEYKPPESNINQISSLYWEDVKRQKELKNQPEGRRPYKASHILEGPKRWQLQS